MVSVFLMIPNKLLFPLVLYLECVTVLGEYLYPEKHLWTGLARSQRSYSHW